MNKILVLFKPDCVARGLVGECLSRFERRGFKIVGIGETVASPQRMKIHYREHAGKPYFDRLVGGMAGRSILATVLEHSGEAVIIGRRILGSDVDPAPGTIRGDYTTSRQENLVHVSATDEAAEREIAIWFNKRDPVPMEL